MNLEDEDIFEHALLFPSPRHVTEHAGTRRFEAGDLSYSAAMVQF
jgi:hypothetical protein